MQSFKRDETARDWAGHRAVHYDTLISMLAGREANVSLYDYVFQYLLIISFAFLYGFAFVAFSVVFVRSFWLSF